MSYQPVSREPVTVINHRLFPLIWLPRNREHAAFQYPRSHQNDRGVFVVQLFFDWFGTVASFLVSPVGPAQ